MKLLAIETATEACSAALYLDGEISYRYRVQPRGHSELILSMMEELLGAGGESLNALDALAFGRGPGSFTGVRIATGIIQGVALGADLPVVPVSTLAAVAQGYHRRTGAVRILPAFDARMKEIYWGAYQLDDSGVVGLVGNEQVCRPESLEVPDGGQWHGAGTGWRTYEVQLRTLLGEALVAVDTQLLCSAVDVAELAVAGFANGEAVAAEQALPVYLRNEVAWKRG